ncbi:MAG: hypothetical protein F6J92_01670 [Symploca sp. SIO1A3]|nr:hypothetical protein [Symploca sp. SIO1A3]
MFRFYANENLSALLVNELRRLGHDVLTSYEAGNANQGIADDRVLMTATANERCVVTFNRDDFLNLHRSGIKHGGIVVCKDDPDSEGQAQVLHNYLITQETLHNRLIRVLKKNQRGASQPVFIEARISKVNAATSSFARSDRSYSMRISHLDNHLGRGLGSWGSFSLCSMGCLCFGVIFC